MGYFWAKDNFLASVKSGSNERIMFYIDSVMYANPDAGNVDGRLPEFNDTNDYSLTVRNGKLYNYSSVYAFSAYLARNFGGAEFFREIVRMEQGIKLTVVVKE